MIYLRAENLGRRFALIARNGTGKTSLLNILAGREEPDGGGKVIIDKKL